MRALLVYSLALTLWSGMAPARELTFCHVKMPPYSFTKADGRPDGIKVQLLQDVVDQIDGVDAQVVFLPWGRCIEYARSGEVDGILPLFRNTDRETFLAFSEPLFEQQIRFWYARSRFPFGIEWSGDFGEVTDLRLGQLSHSFLGTELQEGFEERGRVENATNLEGLMQMLMTERVDLFATDYYIGLYFVRKNGWQDDIAPIERPVSHLPTQFGLSKASGADQYLEAFNTAIEALKESGQVAERIRTIALEG